MHLYIFMGIILPFIGTTVGSACVFLMKRRLGDNIKRAISGFAAGVMVAASVWSLLIPAIEHDSVRALGIFSFLPAAVGLWIGVLALLFVDRLLPEVNSSETISRENRMLFLSVTLHNVPEGMAVGVVYAALLASGSLNGLSGALALSLGIAAQNMPEGAIISMPQAGTGISKWRAFINGTLSGVVEPLSALATLLAVGLVLPALPYLLGFAAGAMIYAVIKELAPIISSGGGDSLGAISFTSGFSLMMILDVMLG